MEKDRKRWRKIVYDRIQKYGEEWRRMEKDGKECRRMEKDREG